MDTITWKRIADYPDYWISDRGDVLSLKMKKSKVLAIAHTRHGYPFIALYKNGKGRIHSLHRLIAQAFIPNPSNEPEVNHINGDKADNRVENLEWVDHSTNINHAMDVLGKIRKPVIQLKDGKIIKRWASGKAACDALGIGRGNLSCCLNGKARSVKGFQWEFA